MKFTFAHNNLNVFDLEKSLKFYKEALGLTVTRTKEAEDGSFKLVYLGDSTTPHRLELTWLRDMDRPYNLGDNEIHLGFTADDYSLEHPLNRILLNTSTSEHTTYRSGQEQPLRRLLLSAHESSFRFLCRYHSARS